jgi:hypothetical protein
MENCRYCIPRYAEPLCHLVLWILVLASVCCCSSRCRRCEIRTLLKRFGNFGRIQAVNSLTIARQKTMQVFVAGVGITYVCEALVISGSLALDACHPKRGVHRIVWVL